MFFQYKSCVDALEEKASRKEMEETTLRVARVFNNTDNTIKKLKSTFEDLTKSNSAFQLKLKIELNKHLETINWFKQLISQIEQKTIRIDNDISSHQLNFENYVMQVPTFFIYWFRSRIRSGLKRIVRRARRRK